MFYKATDKSHEKPSVRASLREAMSSAIMVGAGETFLAPCAVFLHASAIIIGVLQSLPTLLGALFQIVGVYLVEHGFSRRTALIRISTIQAAIWICVPIVVLSESPYSPQLLLAVVSMHYIANGIVAPVWSSLIGDIVASDGRGKFLSERNRRAGLATFVSMLVAGQIISFLTGEELAAWGFAISFIFVAIARIISSVWFRAHEDAVLAFYPEAKFTIWQFLWRLPYSNFARFVSFFSFFHFSVWISAPFFSVYMLRDLGLGYGQYTTLSATTIMSQYFMLPRWGEIIDRYGNKRVLSFCAGGVSIIPILWLLDANFYYLIIVQLYSGVMWSGFNTATSNFLFDAVTPEKRARCVAYQAIINGTLVLSGALVGGYVAEHLYFPLPFYEHLPVPNSIYLTLFFVSACMRILVSMFFLKSFKEVRQVENLEAGEFFMVVAQELPLVGRFVKHK